MLSAPSSAARSAVQNRLQSKLMPIHLCGIGAVRVDEVEAVVDPAELRRERGDARHRRVDVQPDAARAGRSRRSRASGRTPATTWCRGSRRRRTGQSGGAVGGDHRRRARRAASRTRRRAARCGCDRCRCRRCAGPSRCSSAPARWRTRRACDVSPSALTAPAVARQRAARIATSTASLAEPWITPPPCSLVERNRVGEAEQLDHPVEHQRLEFGARRRRDPAHALHAEPGGQQFAEDRRERVVRREVGEEVRVLPLGEAGHDDPIEVGHHGGERFGLGRRMLGQRGAHVAGCDRRLHRAARSTSAM